MNNILSFWRPVLGVTLGLLAGPVGPVRAAEPGAAAPAPAKAAGAVIEVRQTTQDAGTVEQGTLLKYRFRVANRGQANLELTQVKPSCGCTVPKWDRVIAPGKKGVIEAEVNTTHFSGPIMKRLTVISNDPAHPQLDLTLTARITPLVEVKPGLLALLSMDDQPVTQEFTLERPGGRPMQIRQVVTDAPYLRAETTPLPGKGRYKITVTATTETPLGHSILTAVVRTDLEKAPTPTLIVQVERGIVFMPPMLYWSLTGGAVQMPVRGEVTVRRRKRPFHITGVSVDDPKLETQLETVQEGQEYRVLVTYNGGWEGPVVRKTLTVTTDDAKQPEFKIPVQAMLPPPTAAVPAAASPPAAAR
jgi:uncharacterized protein DUF1573